jgi:hypothetical protein
MAPKFLSLAPFLNSNREQIPLPLNSCLQDSQCYCMNAYISFLTRSYTFPPPWYLFSIIVTRFSLTGWVDQSMDWRLTQVVWGKTDYMYDLISGCFYRWKKVKPEKKIWSSQTNIIIKRDIFYMTIKSDSNSYYRKAWLVYPLQEFAQIRIWRFYLI